MGGHLNYCFCLWRLFEEVVVMVLVEGALGVVPAWALPSSLPLASPFLLPSLSLPFQLSLHLPSPSLHLIPTLPSYSPLQSLFPPITARAWGARVRACIWRRGDEGGPGRSRQDGLLLPAQCLPKHTHTHTHTHTHMLHNFGEASLCRKKRLRRTLRLCIDSSERKTKAD